MRTEILGVGFDDLTLAEAVAAGRALLDGQGCHYVAVSYTHLNVFELEDGSAFKITTDRYYSPYWVTPDRSGVLPNLVVDPDLADGVARLLSGKPVEKAGSRCV